MTSFPSKSSNQSPQSTPFVRFVGQEEPDVGASDADSGMIHPCYEVETESTCMTNCGQAFCPKDAEIVVPSNALAPKDQNAVKTVGKMQASGRSILIVKLQCC